MKLHTASVLLAAAHCVAGHYSFRHLILDGKRTGEFEYVRKFSPEPGYPASADNLMLDMPMFDVTSIDLRCGRNGSTLQRPVKTAQIRAGDTIGFGVGAKMTMYHPGFASAWLSRAPDGTTIDAYKGDGNWTKILMISERTEQSMANIETAPYWVQQYRFGKSEKWGAFCLDTYNFTIPKTTPAGKYLLRWEFIYPNAKGNKEGLKTQFWVACSQLDIVNDGHEIKPALGVKIPGHYVVDQPDVNFDSTNTDPKDIVPPKPGVWSG